MPDPEPGPHPPAGRRGRRLVWVLLPVAVAVIAIALWICWEPLATESRRLWWRWRRVPGMAGILVGTFAGQGVRVDDVTPWESDARRSPFRSGDAILEVDGKPVSTPVEARARLGGRFAGEVVRFAVDRQGTRLDFAVELRPPP